MLKLTQADFDQIAERLRAELHSRYALPLKPAKLRELTAHALGYADYNTFKGLQAPATPRPLAECLIEATLCRYTVRGDGLMCYVSHSEEPGDEELGVPDGLTFYLDPVEGHEDAIILYTEDLATFVHRHDNVWVGPEGELLELFDLAPVTTG